MADKLEFANTCPTIDGAIDTAKELVERMIDAALETACPLLTQEQLDAQVKIEMDRSFKFIEGAFDDCRESNVQMREAADDQIFMLDGELKESQRIEVDLNARTVELENDLSGADARIVELKDTIEEYKTMK